jgi:hypothetical protein
MRDQSVFVELLSTREGMDDNGTEEIFREGSACRGGMEGHCCCSLEKSS